MIKFEIKKVKNNLQFERERLLANCSYIHAWTTLQRNFHACPSSVVQVVTWSMHASVKEIFLPYLDTAGEFLQTSCVHHIGQPMHYSLAWLLAGCIVAAGLSTILSINLAIAATSFFYFRFHELHWSPGRRLSLLFNPNLVRVRAYQDHRTQSAFIVSRLFSVHVMFS